MKLVVKTKSGTIFVLNKENMTWVREGRHAALLGGEGQLVTWPDIQPGNRMTLEVRRSGIFHTRYITSTEVTAVFEVGPHDEEMYGLRIPKSKAETQAYIDNYNKTGAVGKDSPSKFVVPNIITSSAVSRFRRDEANVKSIREHAAEMSAKSEEGSVKHPHCDSNVLHAPGKCKFCDLYPNRQKSRIANYVNFTGEGVPGLSPCPSVIRRTLDKIEKWPGNRPMTQADGFAGENDPLEFATLPTGAKLRYTDETRTTFKYVPKGWTDLGPEDEPRKATVCTRDEGHTGPCNGYPRIEREGMCFGRTTVLIADIGRLGRGTTLYLVSGVAVSQVHLREQSFMQQAEHILGAAREFKAEVHTDNYALFDFLEKKRIPVKMIHNIFPGRKFYEKSLF